MLDRPPRTTQAAKSMNIFGCFLEELRSIPNEVSDIRIALTRERNRRDRLKANVQKTKQRIRTKMGRLRMQCDQLTECEKEILRLEALPTSVHETRTKFDQ